MRMILVLTAMLVLAGAASEAAAPRAATRASRFARLPNWSGLWASAAWNLGISGRPPYNAQWEAKYQAALQDKVGLAARSATFKVCTRSFPALMEAPWQFEIAALPEETLLVFENGQVRHVYTDGRAHPWGDDLWATPLGDSIGHWEGQTLVVDTVARSASEPMAPRAWVALLSEGAHFTERLRQIDANTLEDQLLIDDPTALASPWTMTLKFRRVTEMDRMIPVDCVENERTTVVDGKMVITNP
jgi:hypothetical protein